MSNSTRDIDQLSERKELPEGWRWVKLGDVCATTSGGTPSRGNKEFFCGNIPWIKSGELRDGFIHNAEESITEEGLCASSAKIMPRGTLLIAMYGATVGRLGINQIDAATNQAVCGIMTNTDIETDFLFLYLLMIRDVLINKSFGGAQPNISQTVIQNLSIPLPPLPEQQRIASILKEQMVAVEKARTAAQERLKAIKALPAAFLRQIFPDPGQPLPEGWRWAKMGDVCHLKTGGTPSKSDALNFGGDIKWLVSGDVSQGEISDCMGRITMDGMAKSNAALLPPGSVMIALNGQGKTRGTVALLCVEATCNQSLVAMIPRDRSELLPRFLLYHFQMRYKELRDLTGDSHRSGLNIGILNRLEVILAPFDEQQRIVALIKEQLAAIEQARTAAEAELKAINTLPVALLRRAFNGEL